jgi:glucokinase
MTAKAGYALVADLGGTKIAAARVSPSGEITHSLQAPTPAEGDESIIQVLLQVLDELPQKGVQAIGVDVPGLVYPHGKVWAPNLPGWEDMPLSMKLKKHFKLPVLVESDRNAFVTGEAWKGAARGCQDVVFLAVGTGIGAGIISGGRLLRGYRELAGCAGWLAVRDSFLPEYEAIGCLEAHAAGPAIARRARKILKQSMNASEVARVAREGNLEAEKILHDAGHYLGLALANLVSLLNPEMIVIGGGVAEAGELLLAPARETMKRWAQPLAARQVKIVRSKLGGQAPWLGMAKLAFGKCVCE